MKQMKLLSCLAMLSWSLVAIAPSAWAKTLVFCSEGSPRAFNPQMESGGTSFDAVDPVYDRLIMVNPDNMVAQPSLATSWEISADGLTYTFKLRQDVWFHKAKHFTPTRPLNADDVIFTINRQRLSTHPYHKVSGAVYEYFSSLGLGRLIKDVKKLDEHTVQIVLTEPMSPFLGVLGMDFAAVFSKEYADAMLKAGTPEMVDTWPIGTGAYFFVSYKKDSMIRYKANPKYWQGATPVESLVFVITPDSSVRTQKLKAGECHVIPEPQPSDHASLAKHKNINLVSRAGLNVGYLAINTQRKPFDNPLVRRAINHALNVESYIKAVYLGTATRAATPLPPTVWGFDPSIKNYNYNPKKARALLKQAGFAEGFETDVWAIPVARPYNPNGKKMAELMQADLAVVGIKVKVVTYDWPTYLKKTMAGEHSMMMLGWSADSGDPDDFMANLLSCDGVASGQNVARWCHKPYNDLVMQARRLSDQGKRETLYKKAQQIFHEQTPWVPLAYSKIYKATSKKVVGFKVDPFGRNRFYGVDLKK